MKKILILLFIVVSLTLAGCSKKQEPLPSSNEPQKTEENKETTENPEEKVMAPDFELKTLGGKNIKLSDLRGKVVVMNFYATWCPPCKAELPGFIATAEKYKDKDVQFLFIDVAEKKSDVEKFLKERKYNIDPLMDDESEVFSGLYGLRSFPTTFILDRDGYIAYGNEGFMDEAALKSAIEKALSGK